MKIITKILSILAIILGVFLIADDFFLHMIIFDYTKFGLEWLDPYIDHWVWGLIFLILGYLSLRD